jgi:regulatory protein
LSSIDLEKIKHYCAYQERCHSEVRSKLLELKVYGLELENYISILIEENYLNEERYACSYARGKFRFKQWGKTKIKYQLKAKQISPYLINKAMQEIDDEEYWQVLTTLAEKKSQSLQTEKNRFIKSQKIRNYLLQKGFESGLIYEVMKDLGIAE